MQNPSYSEWKCDSACFQPLQHYQIKITTLSRNPKMTLHIGDNAPDFSLKTKNADGLKDISLSDHKDKQAVVLLFFPFAFTSVCTEETCSVRDDMSSYNELNAQVYGVSVDSPFAQEVMAEKENLNFP